MLGLFQWHLSGEGSYFGRRVGVHAARTAATTEHDTPHTSAPKDA